MRRHKVCVYAICKNESHFVDRWMDSMQEADLVVVTDTGSTDDTVEHLRARGAVVYVQPFNPFRFDVARNASLSHVPDDVDIAVCTDLDEVFHPGWRAHLERAWQEDATMGNYIYNWSLKPDGTPDTQFHYFKIHRPKDYVWSCPIHEFLRYAGTGPEKKVFLEGVVLDHHPDPEKSRGSYLPLLEMAVAEEPESDRMTYYLGREYMYAQRWADCIRTLEGYLKLPSAWWAEERCAAMRWIAKAYHECGDDDTAYRWYWRAIAEVPGMRDAYVEFAQIAYARSDWQSVLFATKRALTIPEKSTCYVNAGYAWDATPDDLAAIACFQLGLYTQALAHAERALTFAPEEPRLRKNRDIIRAKLNEA
ncbi:MAG: glycosyltransferase [Oscillospiraceae bacterium]|nr:glycosyltransferase [Oscillospiraceae bacterium]